MIKVRMWGMIGLTGTLAVVLSLATVFGFELTKPDVSSTVVMDAACGSDWIYDSISETYYWYENSGEPGTLTDDPDSFLCEVGTPTGLTGNPAQGSRSRTCEGENIDPVMCNAQIYRCGDNDTYPETDPNTGETNDHEQCDDGNDNTADGCDQFCNIEPVDLIISGPQNSCLIYGYDYTFLAVDEESTAYEGYQMIITDESSNFNAFNTWSGTPPSPGNNLININNIGERLDHDGQLQVDHYGNPYSWDWQGIFTIDILLGSQNHSFSRCVAIEVCGDGIVSGTEECDDGNLSNGDDCSANCQLIVNIPPTPNDDICSDGEWELRFTSAFKNSRDCHAEYLSPKATNTQSSQLGKISSHQNKSIK